MKFEELFCGNGRYGNIREILFRNGRYGKVREIFRTGMDGTGSPGIPVPYRTVREISRTVATLTNELIHKNVASPPWLQVCVNLIFFATTRKFLYFMLKNYLAVHDW